MPSKLLLSAALLAALTAPALAEDQPVYDAALQRQIVEHLQSKLPQMRSAYGLTQQAAIATPEREDRRDWISKISMDGVRKYSGRIVWL